MKCHLHLGSSDFSKFSRVKVLPFAGRLRIPPRFYILGDVCHDSRLSIVSLSNIYSTTSTLSIFSIRRIVKKKNGLELSIGKYFVKSVLLVAFLS